MLIKYAHFIVISHPYATLKLAGIFFTNVVRLHGFPKTSVSYKVMVFLRLVFFMEMPRSKVLFGRKCQVREN